MIVFLLHLLANGNEISNALDVIGVRSVDLLIQFQGCWVCTHTSITWSDHQSPFHFIRFNLGSSRKEGDGSLVVVVTDDFMENLRPFQTFSYIQKSRFKSSCQEVWWKPKMAFPVFPNLYLHHMIFPFDSYVTCYMNFLQLQGFGQVLFCIFLSSSGLIHLLFHVVNAQPCDHIHINWPIPVGFQVVVKGLGPHHQLCWRDWPILPTHLSNIQIDVCHLNYGGPYQSLIKNIKIRM